MKFRIPEAVLNELSGTTLWQEPHKYDPYHPEVNAMALALSEKLRTTRSTRKDGSILIELSEREARTLYGYMDVWLIGATDNVRDDPGTNLGQIRSAQSMMRRLTDTFGYGVSRWES